MKFLNKYNYNQTGGSSVINDLEFKEKNFFFAKFVVGDEFLNIKKKLCFKIDVERHEINVIEGLKKTLKQNETLILIEIYEKNFNMINKTLGELGFNQIKNLRKDQIIFTLIL